MSKFAALSLTTKKRSAVLPSFGSGSPETATDGESTAFLPFFPSLPP